MSDPCTIFKSLADPTRLRTLLLIRAEGELCVCELAAALDLSQPKVSRHLAQLRGGQLLQDRRQGQWVYYRLPESLPAWLAQLLASIPDQDGQLDTDRQRLAQMGDRPTRQAACC